MSEVLCDASLVEKFIQAGLVSVVVVAEELILVLVLVPNQRLFGVFKFVKVASVHIEFIHFFREGIKSEFDVNLVFFGAAIR